MSDFTKAVNKANAETTLAAMLPPREGHKGANTRIEDIQYLHVSRGGKEYLACLIVASNMARANAYGNGNRAARREAMAFMPEERLTEHDVNRMATIDEEIRTEGRRYKLSPA